MTRGARPGAERYPLALAALERLLSSTSGARERAGPQPDPLAPGRHGPLGPSILRAPPEVARRPPREVRALDDERRVDGEERTEDLLGELVDMVFVSADEQSAAAKGHEVHLVFKAEVLGGLHLRLRKTPEGMHATFIVEDAAARRAVLDHADALIARLKERGFTIVGHEVNISARDGDEGGPP